MKDGSSRRIIFIVALVAPLMALVATPAHACRPHRYWHYPWPQRCGVAASAQRPAARHVAYFAPRRPPASPVAPARGAAPTDDEERARGIEMLKAMLRAGAIQAPGE